MSEILDRLAAAQNQGFPDIDDMAPTADELDKVEAVLVAVAKARDANGLLTMFRLPPAIALAIVRMLKPGAWEAEKEAINTRGRLNRA